MLNFIRTLDCLIGRFVYLFLRIRRAVQEPPSPESLTIRKILCIKLWGLGNLVVVSPLLSAIKKRFSEAELIFLTFDLNRGFLERNAAVGRVVYFKYTKNFFFILCRFIACTIRFRRERIDIVVNFETFNNASALFSCLTKAPLRLGISNGYEAPLYTHPFRSDQSEHISQTFMHLLTPLCGPGRYSYFDFPRLEKEKEAVTGLLARYGINRFVCIHPGTSDNFKGKRYRKEYLSELAGLIIRRHGAQVVFTGTGEERELAGEIMEMMAQADNVFNVAGELSIWEFIELLRRSHVFISSDSGPVHIAASLGINTAVFYGPTSPARYGPFNKNSLVFYNGIACSPCVATGYVNRDCRNRFRCLDFDPKEIFRQISERYFHD